jgi:hypothetical protein
MSLIHPAVVYYVERTCNLATRRYSNQNNAWNVFWTNFMAFNVTCHNPSRSVIRLREKCAPKVSDVRVLKHILYKVSKSLMSKSTEISKSAKTHIIQSLWYQRVLKHVLYKVSDVKEYWNTYYTKSLISEYWNTYYTKCEYWNTYYTKSLISEYWNTYYTKCEYWNTYYTKSLISEYWNTYYTKCEYWNTYYTKSLISE